MAARPWAADEIANDIAIAHADRVARRLDGIVANDDRVRQAVQTAIEKPGDASAIPADVASVLTW